MASRIERDPASKAGEEKLRFVNCEPWPITPNSSPPVTRPPLGPSQLRSLPPLLNCISASLSAATKRRGGAPPPSPPPDDSNESLGQERKLRIKAETRLQEVTGELEDLSASLFQQANKMIRNERWERANLEERVAVLEGREGRTKGQLGLLERAAERVGRVREVLADGQKKNISPSIAGSLNRFWKMIRRKSRYGVGKWTVKVGVQAIFLINYLWVFLFALEKIARNWA